MTKVPEIPVEGLPEEVTSGAMADRTKKSKSAPRKKAADAKGQAGAGGDAPPAPITAAAKTTAKAKAPAKAKVMAKAKAPAKAKAAAKEKPPVKPGANKAASMEEGAPRAKVAPAPLRVLFTAAEVTPFIKTGGLADVAGTLPVALKKIHVDARVILPKYRDIPAQWQERMQYLTHFYVQMGWRRQYCGIQFLEHEGVTFYFVDNEFYFSRDSIYGEGAEEGERFGFFCRAVLEALTHINYYPEVLHCNDWQTGMIPVLLRLQYANLPQYAGIKTLFTIHNLKYQGVFEWRRIDDLFALGSRFYTPDLLEFYGDISFLKAGLVFADHISTVSPTYAYEIQSAYYGERLDGLLRARRDSLTGILNGIDYDIWNPATDALIEHHYDAGHMEGKAECKRLLQRELSLPEDDGAMVVAMVTRLTEQKGLSLIEHVLDEMMRLPIQLVVVGQGDRHFMEMLTWAQWRYQGKVAARFEQNEWLAHNVYAGADLFLMPSRFEPCGISQLIALRYGAAPLVRETGGLYDTVQPYNKYSDEGTGLSFSNYNAHEMLYTLEQAVKYYQDRKLWAKLLARGMGMKFDWARSAGQYRELYEKLRSAE